MLMQKLRNDGQPNIYKWVKKIADEFCEKQAIEDHTSFNNIKNKFHDDLHDSFLCTIPTLLFKFLINKGLSHIVKP